MAALKYKVEIQERVVHLHPGMTPLHSQYLGIYQGQLKEITKDMEDEEKEELEETAKNWNECGPPTETKRR